MSTLEDSLNVRGGDPGAPSHASSPVSSLDDLSGTRESGLGEEASSWLPDQGRGARGRKDGGGGGSEGDGEEGEDSEEEEIIMEEFR